MKTSSAMSQRSLLIVAFAAFTSASPLHFLFPPCSIITEKLQNAFQPLDPHTFPNISDFIYTHGNTSLLFNFTNVRLGGFSNITCENFNDIDEHVALLTLGGPELNFFVDDSHAHGLLNGSSLSLRSGAIFQVFNYSLALRFNYDLGPLSFCISSGSLRITSGADLIKTRFISKELDLADRTHELVEDLNGYLPRFANDLTSLLNKTLCNPPNPVPPSATSGIVSATRTVTESTTTTQPRQSTTTTITQPRQSTTTTTRPRQSTTPMLRPINSPREPTVLAVSLTPEMIEAFFNASKKKLSSSRSRTTTGSNRPWHSFPSSMPHRTRDTLRPRTITGRRTRPRTKNVEATPQVLQLLFKQHGLEMPPSLFRTTTTTTKPTEKTSRNLAIKMSSPHSLECWLTAAVASVIILQLPTLIHL